MCVCVFFYTFVTYIYLYICNILLRVYMKTHATSACARAHTQSHRGHRCGNQCRNSLHRNPFPSTPPYSPRLCLSCLRETERERENVRGKSWADLSRRVAHDFSCSVPNILNQAKCVFISDLPTSRIEGHWVFAQESACHGFEPPSFSSDSGAQLKKIATCPSHKQRRKKYL